MNIYIYIYRERERAKNSPPQQKPAAPIAEIPWLFTASITAFASSNPLSYSNNFRAPNTHKSAIYVSMYLFIYVGLDSSHKKSWFHP
jgi:hypothetical protein